MMEDRFAHLYNTWVQQTQSSAIRDMCALVQDPEVKSLARDPGRRECPRCGEMTTVSPLERSPRSAVICPYCGYAIEATNIWGEGGPTLEHRVTSNEAEEEMQWIPDGIDLDQLLDTLPPPGIGDETQAPTFRPATPRRPVGRKGLLGGLLGRLRREPLQ